MVTSVYSETEWACHEWAPYVTEVANPERPLAFQNRLYFWFQLRSHVVLLVVVALCSLLLVSTWYLDCFCD